MSTPYDDIMDLPHPTSKLRPRMPIGDRAAQFAPFAALTGYNEMIRESERQTVERPELTEERAAELSARVRLVQDRAAERPFVEIQMFEPLDGMQGGRITILTGAVRRVDEAMRILEFTDGRSVALDNICALRIRDAGSGVD